MKKNINQIKIIIGFTVTILPFLFLTCDSPLGLGDRLNLTGPILTIIAPVPEKEDQTDIQVGDYFELKGITTGEAPATRLEIQMTRFDNRTNTLIELGREWKYDRIWQWKKDSDVSWQHYTQDNYQGQGFSNPVWTVSGNDVSWNIPISLHELPKGDFFISIRVWNAAGHSDSNSVVKIKVIHDSDDPELTIVRYNKLLPGNGSAGNPDIPVEFLVDGAGSLLEQIK